VVLESLNSHGWWHWLFWIVPGSAFIGLMATYFAAKAFEFRDRFICDNYWVIVTETHLCVLSKRNGLAIEPVTAAPMIYDPQSVTALR
jgi:hypothetical protein